MNTQMLRTSTEIPALEGPLSNAGRLVKTQSKKEIRAHEIIHALMAGQLNQDLATLKAGLESLGIETRWVPGYREAAKALTESKLPDIIFCATRFADGSWVDIRSIAASASRPVPVVVVSPVVDIELYLNTIEGGATDFIVPPFNFTDVAFIVECAMRSGSASGSSLKKQAASA